MACSWCDVGRSRRGGGGGGGVRATLVGASIWASTPKFGGFVEKPNSSRASKQTSIFHTPPNSPSHPPFLEALHSPSKSGTHHFFLFSPPLHPLSRSNPPDSATRTVRLGPASPPHPRRCAPPCRLAHLPLSPAGPCTDSPEDPAMLPHGGACPVAARAQLPSRGGYIRPPKIAGE
jgi:hypothetical protein